MNRYTFLGLLIAGCLGFIAGVLFSLSHAVPNAVHQERMKATEKSVGTYQLDAKTGQIVYVYLDLQEYTAYVVRQVTPTRVPPQVLQ